MHMLSGKPESYKGLPSISAEKHKHLFCFLSTAHAVLCVEALHEQRHDNTVLPDQIASGPPFVALLVRRSQGPFEPVVDISQC